MKDAPTFPQMSDYESRVFRRFVRAHKPGFHDHPIQLEGNKQLPVCAAGHRLVRKGILRRDHSCSWRLTELGRQMAVEWQRKNK